MENAMGSQRINMAVVGSGGVGKSAFTIMYIAGRFITEYDPTIEDNFRKQITVDDQVCIVDILDTAGQENYHQMREMWMRSSEGFILMYSIVDLNSFHDIQDWYNQITRVKDTSRPCAVLAGNKFDLQDQRKISTIQGQDLANKWGLRFYETSAKTDYNISEVFSQTVREIRNYRSQVKYIYINKLLLLFLYVKLTLQNYIIKR